MPLDPAPLDLLAGIPADAVPDAYAARGLAELDDQRLVEAAASVIGVPLVEARPDRISFVLHAPLELLARAALLPLVGPAEREAARLRVVELAAGYQAAGDPVGPPAAVDVPDLATAATRLLGALAAGDLDEVDALAAWLGARARPDQLTALLGDAVIDRLGAAGHASIFFALLARTQPRGLPGQVLRHPLRALAQDPDRHIAVPPVTVGLAEPTFVERRLREVADVPASGPPASPFIAPLLEFAAEGRAFDPFLEPDGTFAASDGTPFGILRFAAQAMLQGPTEQAPYGWTHCLTLAQAPLVCGPSLADPGRAAFVATAYLAAHWFGHGVGSVDLTHVPEPVAVDLPAALEADPATAAAAAWHAPDRSATAHHLATAAALAEDAHHVKHTLACLDAAAADPDHAPLHLAAAAHLAAWWAHLA